MRSSGGAMLVVGQNDPIHGEASGSGPESAPRGDSSTNQRYADHTFLTARAASS